MNLTEKILYDDNHCIISLAMSGVLNKMRKLAKAELEKGKLVYIVTEEIVDEEFGIEDPKVFIFHKPYEVMIDQFKRNINGSDGKAVSVLFHRVKDMNKFNKDNSLLYNLTNGNMELFAFVQLESNR